MDWTTAAVSGGAGLLGQLVGGLFGRANQKYQNEWNLEMWHRQNEYNSPIQQMARYQEAGLNPNLIYSQGSPGNSQSMPSSAENKYQPDFSFVGNSLMQGMQSEQMQHQNEVLKADQNLKIVQALKASNEAYGIDLDNIRKMLENDALPEQLRLDLAQRAENLTNKMNENALQLQQINLNADTYDDRVAFVSENLNLLKAQTASALAKAFLDTETAKQVAPNARSLRKLQANQGYYYSELAKVQDSIKKLNEQQKKNLAKSFDILSFEYDNLPQDKKVERIEAFYKALNNAIGDMKGSERERLLTLVWRFVAETEGNHVSDLRKEILGY